MARTEHTPGPWKTIKSPHGPKYRCVQFGADEMYTSLEMLPADARLCAAAPELLQALKDLSDWLAYGLNKADGAEPTDEDHAACERVAAQARAAVDKAEGR